MIWQTRTISTFVAAIAQTDGDNPLIEQAQNIGKKPEQQATAAEPAEGSYERFFSTFGSPNRWAGHG